MSSPGSRAATCRGRPCGACQRARRVRSVSSPAVCRARCSSTVSRCRRVASPARRRARCTVLGATCGRAAMLLPGLLSSQRWLPVSVSVELSAGHLTLQFKNIYSPVACRALQQERLLHPHSAAVRASAASRRVFISYHDRARSIRRGRWARPTQRKEPCGGSGERSHLPKCFPTCESSLACIASLRHTGNRLDGVAGLHNPARGGRVP